MNTINQRIRNIRKSKKLNQKEFGLPIGLKRSTVGDIERDGQPVTDKNIILICKEYNIDEHWLRTGEGNMEKQGLFFLDAYAKKYNLSNKEKSIMAKFISLDSDIRELVIKNLENIIDIKDHIENKTTKVKLVARGGEKSISIDSDKLKSAILEDTLKDDNNSDLF